MIKVGKFIFNDSLFPGQGDAGPKGFAGIPGRPGFVGPPGATVSFIVSNYGHDPPLAEADGSLSIDFNGQWIQALIVCG